MENELQPESPSNCDQTDRAFKIKAAFFLSGVTGISALIGFGATLAAAKKKDPQYFEQGVIGKVSDGKVLHETGASLALRALGWGTFFAFTGCGILFYSISKLSGANTFEEFRLKMGSILPRIPKKEVQEGRTEFEGLTDLLNYLQHQKGAKDK